MSEFEKSFREPFEEYRDEAADQLRGARRFGSAVSPAAAKEAKKNARRLLEQLGGNQEYREAEAAHRSKQKFLRSHRERSQAEEAKSREEERRLAEEIEKMLSPDAKADIRDYLRRLAKAKDNYQDANTEPVEAACQSRFGLSWLEVRRQLFEKTSKPLRLLESAKVNGYPIYRDAFTIMPRDLVGANYGTRSWMTDEFMTTLDLL